MTIHLRSVHALHSLRSLRSLTARLALGLLLAGGLGSTCLAQSAPIESLSHFPRTTLDIAADGRHEIRPLTFHSPNLCDGLYG